ncbi:MAG: Rpn family recombination-promoting nuclease/putative transposase [Defluviitaleaceae bacterium]|nr:Rpn family recombination-promoting nuclease/putative transposase [Defluviitaleaceae bacterium]
MKYVNPTNDLAFKKVLGNNDNIHILAGFIRDFFFIDPDGLTVENPYSIKSYRELLKDEESFRWRLTVPDIAAVMSFADYRSELQIRKERYFDERSIYYPLDKFVSRYRILPGKDSGYARLRPAYSMTILGFNHFTADEDALRIFRLHDPVRNKSFPKQLINLGYFELPKPAVETENQRQWQNYFLQKPLSGDAPDYIHDALQIIDRANMDEEELHVLTQIEYYRTAYDNQLSFAKDEGKAEGKVEGEAAERRSIAITMLKMGLSKEQVSQATKLDIDEILKIEDAMQRA